MRSAPRPPPHPGLVQKITLNGRVQGTDPATGAEFRPHLLSVSAHRDVIPCDSRLKHAQLQADACLARLDARISVDPLALLEVEPKEPCPQTPPQEGNGPS